MKTSRYSSGIPLQGLRRSIVGVLAEALSDNLVINMITRDILLGK